MLRTVSRTPVPQAGRLADGRVPSPVSLFLNLSQVPVDRGARIPYTGLAFSLASQTKNKAMSEVWKPFWAPNLARFYGLILQRALYFDVIRQTRLVASHFDVDYCGMVHRNKYDLLS